MLPAWALHMVEPPHIEPSGSGFGGIYEHVAQLERKLIDERSFVVELVKAVRALETNFAKAEQRLVATEADLRNPRRDFHIRQEMRDMKAQLESDVVRGHEQIHNSVGPRMAELQDTLVEM